MLNNSSMLNIGNALCLCKTFNPNTMVKVSKTLKLGQIINLCKIFCLRKMLNLNNKFNTSNTTRFNDLSKIFNLNYVLHLSEMFNHIKVLFLLLHFLFMFFIAIDTSASRFGVFNSMKIIIFNHAQSCKKTCTDVSKTLSPSTQHVHLFSSFRVSDKNCVQFIRLSHLLLKINIL